MCEPTTLAAMSLALTAATAVVSYQGQTQQYKTQMAMEKARHDASLVMAFAGARDEQNQLSKRQMQEADATALKVKGEQLDEAEAVAEAKTKSIGAGVTGISIDSIMGDLSQKAAGNREVLRKNYDNVAAQLQDEQRATITRAQSRIYMPGVASKPSILTPLLQIAGAGIGFGKDMATIERNDRIDAKFGLRA